MEITEEIKDILVGAKRELFSGIGMDSLVQTPTYTELELESVMDKVLNTSAFDELECPELKTLRNLLCDLLRELDTFEFSTRLGFSEDEVFEVLKTVKKTVDQVCYSK